MKAMIVSLGLLLSLQLHAQKGQVVIPTKFPDAVPVLNVGTFHMGYSTDDHTTEFDEHNKENVLQVHKIAKAIAAFKPTVIIVETPPGYDSSLQKEYKEYLQHPEMKFEHPSEIELLAYEVGRLCGVQRIYGIDYKEGYNYMVSQTVRNSKDSASYHRYMQLMEDFDKKYPEDNLPVAELLQRTNHPDFLDLLITVNADILTHIASPGKAEGADEAAKYYHRNLVMYSNLNQVKLSKDDRVFILMGGSHTAFFNDFMRRSPKYKLVDVLPYLQ